VASGLPLRFIRFRLRSSSDGEHLKRTEKLEDRCLPHGPVYARNRSQVLNVSAAKTATGLFDEMPIAESDLQQLFSV